MLLCASQDVPKTEADVSKPLDRLALSKAEQVELFCILVLEQILRDDTTIPPSPASPDSNLVNLAERIQQTFQRFSWLTVADYQMLLRLMTLVPTLERYLYLIQIRRSEIQSQARPSLLQTANAICIEALYDQITGTLMQPCVILSQSKKPERSAS
jgi:hypothetical protein